MESWSVCEHEMPLQKLKQPIPDLSPDELLVEVTHCGVCRSDVHFWQGFYDLGGGKRFNISERGVKLPVAVGHEIYGKVAKIGSGVEGVSVGDPRIVYPWVGCGKCRRCQQGSDNICSAQRSLGVMVNGGFASHVVVPHSRYLVDPGDLDPALACTYACSGLTTYSSIRKILPLEPEDPVILIGSGGLGLAAIGILRALGHRNIVSIDLREDNRNAALAAGATAAIDGAVSDVASKVMAAAGGPILGVIDFVNVSSTASLGYSLLARGGKIVQVGIMGGQLDISLVALVLKAATIQANVTGTLADLREVVALARAGKLQALPVTTMPWDEANSALDRLENGDVVGRLVLKR